MEINELVDLYRTKSESELFTIYLEISNYTAEAKQALIQVMEERGGVDYVESLYDEKRNTIREEERLQRETIELLKENNSIEEIEEILDSLLIKEEERKYLIKETAQFYKEQKQDSGFSIRIFLLGMLGGTIGSLVGGVLLMLILQVYREVYIATLIFLLILNYISITIVTKRDYKNVTVIILTLVFTVVAMAIATVFIQDVDLTKINLLSN